MNNKTQPSADMEQKLDRLYNTPAPNPAFAAGLERTLIAKAHMNTLSEQTHQNPLAALFRRPAFAVGLAVLLLALLSTALIGPQKVSAAIQQLLGYLPGYGFVQPEEIRYLAAPISVQQGEVTVTVNTVQADPKYTEITLIASGLPHIKFGPFGETPKEAQPYLLLPDGVKLEMSGAASGIGDTLNASLNFPAIPADVSQFTLVLPRLPSLPAGFAPENWSILLTLQAAQPSPAAPGSDLVAPYTPANNSASLNGVTVNLTQVGQSAQETGLQVQFNWQDPAWTRITSIKASISDDLRNLYPSKKTAFGGDFELTNPANGASSQTGLLRYEPFSKQARQGILTIESIDFQAQVNTSLRLGLGSNPQPGQIWELAGKPGMDLDFDGVPVQVLQAELGQAVVYPDGRTVYGLTLLVQTEPKDGKSIVQAGFGLEPGVQRSSSSETLSGGQFRWTVDLEQLPGSSLTIYFPYVEVSVAGPWTIQWDLP